MRYFFIDTHLLDPEERVHEIATLLARAVLRLQQQQEPTPEGREKALEVAPDPAHAGEIEGVLDRLGVDNVVVATAEPGAVGHPSQAPYDVILLAGAVTEVPEALLAQIDDGGRLIAVVDDGRIGKGTMFVRVHGAVGRKVLFDANIPPLEGLSREPDFVF